MTYGNDILIIKPAALGLTEHLPRVRHNTHDTYV